jgi:hypothetical protein
MPTTRRDTLEYDFKTINIFVGGSILARAVRLTDGDAEGIWLKLV